jgi:hypothetical protein
MCLPRLLRLLLLRRRSGAPPPSLGSHSSPHLPPTTHDGVGVLLGVRVALELRLFDGD